MPLGVSQSSWKQPLRVWLIVLTTVFAVEMILMLLLRYFPLAKETRYLETIVDPLLLTFVIAPVLWFLIVRPLKRANDLRSLYLTDLFTSIEAERRRVANELHDGVGQSLTLLISGLRSTLPEIHDSELESRCRKLKELAKQSLSEVKRVSLGLRPSLLDDLGLAVALKQLTADFQEHHAIKAYLDTDKISDRRLPETLETTLFRITQEALANVLTHSRASEVSIRLRLHEQEIELSIEDNGIGIEPEKIVGNNPGHLGLTGIRERAMAIGGRVVIQSNIGKGTGLFVYIPIRETIV
jgi:signal transduction histidine kinase